MVGSPGFLERFLPSVLRDQNDPSSPTGLYCSYNNQVGSCPWSSYAPLAAVYAVPLKWLLTNGHTQILQLMTSSLFLAGLLSLSAPLALSQRTWRLQCAISVCAGTLCEISGTTAYLNR